jgi:hypothetical protein
VLDSGFVAGKNGLGFIAVLVIGIDDFAARVVTGAVDPDIRCRVVVRVPRGDAEVEFSVGIVRRLLIPVHNHSEDERIYLENFISFDAQ